MKKEDVFYGNVVLYAALFLMISFVMVKIFSNAMQRNPSSSMVSHADHFQDSYDLNTMKF